MKRRKFIQATALASAVPLAACASTQNIQSSMDTTKKELYEIRTYQLKFGSNSKPLLEYLKTALKPAMERAGVNHFMLFTEVGKSEPKKIWALISYPSANIYVQAQNLQSDAAYVAAAATYNAVPTEKPIYNRFESSLLLAFDGLAKMLDPVDNAGLYELRIYEGVSEDAVRRKIMMFDKEEITLFHKVGLHPVFFGEMLAGPYRPCLAYMLNFTDMEQRNANWKKFIQHPDWEEMKNKDIYANTVSNIRKVFLEPLS